MGLENQSKRIEWIDILKGFAIICVILGHRKYGNNGLLSTYFVSEVYSFHIPLFFFASGLVFSIAKYDSFKNFLIKKIKTILVPMVFFSFIQILFNFAYYGVLLGSKNADYGINYFFNSLLGIILQIRNGKYEATLWFFSCLFITQCIFYWVIKIFKNRTFPIIFTIGTCFVLGSVYMYLGLPRLPWNADCAFIAILFLGLGYIIKNENNIMNRINKIWLIPILLLLNILTMYLNYNYMGKDHVDLALSCIGFPLWYFLESIAGVWLIFIVVSKIKTCKPLSYIGKNSLVYYGLVDLMVFIPDIIIFNILHLDIKSTGDWSVLINFIYAIVVCISIVPINELINRKLKFIKGQF